ncbi:MAG: ABC transporter substrate-binding protein, partial [Methanomicrobia archaeon]|nr:ABC transporter substrate-binding protein [Methanomicrobia archaeon]
MKKEWKRISFFLMTIMLASTLSGCIGEKEETPAPTTPAPTTPAPVEDIKIGCIWPLTGDLAAYGAANKRALELAVEIINNKYPDLNLPLAASEGLPNLGGAKIKLIWGDSRGTPEEGRSAAEYLIINEEVVALLGCYQSAVTETASLPAETYGVPFLNPDSSSPTLTERGYKWFWRCTPKAIDWTRNALEFYTDINEKFDANLHTYGIFNEDTLWGVESGDWLEYWADEFGFEVIERVQYPHETPDLSAEVLRMKQANPDLVHIAGYISDSILYVKTMKENNWLPKMVMSGEMIQMSDFLDALGDDGNYFCLTILFPQDLVTTKALTVKLNEMMDERYGKTFDDPSARAFTG